MKIPFLEFHGLQSYNREVFLIEHGDLVKTFVAIDNSFHTLVQLPGTKRDRNGKSYVGLVPFIFLLQRQAQSAFEALAVFQSYQAWVLLRPGIEAALIIGKWVDDPRNAEIWKNRENNTGLIKRRIQVKAYIQRAYQTRNPSRVFCEKSTTTLFMPTRTTIAGILILTRPNLNL